MSLESLFYKIGILQTVLFLCFTMDTRANAQQEIIWETNFERAITQANTLNRPLFLHFYGDNCPPCKLMETNVFKNGQVINQMNQSFVPLKIKVSEQTQLAKKYSIQVIPTDIVLTQDGRLIHRRQGGIATERFLEYLHFLLSHVNRKANQEMVQQVSTPIQSVPEPINSTSSPISPLQFQSLSSQTAVPVQPTGTPTNTITSIQKAEQPKTEISQTEQLPKMEQPLRDPFTRQPVTSPVSSPVSSVPSPPVASNQMSNQTLNQTLNQTQPEPVNPVRVTEKKIPQEEKTVFQEKTVLPKTVDMVSIPQTPKEPTTVPAVSPMGFQNNPDETITATTMVEVPLGLEGYCPVLLSTEERWIPGNPAYYTMYRGHVFRFSSEEAMTEFMKTPANYAPVAMGEDIVLMVDRNKKVYGNRKFGAWFQGRVFLFSTQDSLDSFASRPEYYAEIALKYETALKGISGRFF
jgi:YHS domain-containing protein/thioredoxin-related protein